MAALAEVAAWWIVLFGLYAVLISTLSPLELAVGAGAAFVGAVAGPAARRAVRGR